MVNSELYDPEKVFEKKQNPPFGASFSSLRIMPSLFIIGAQKAGTTSLYSALIQHPEIIPSRKKEIFYYGNTFHYTKGLNWYKQHFVLRMRQRCYNFLHGVKSFTLDASTNTFEHADAPTRIIKDVPNAKIILILRNPTERAFSHYLLSKKMKFDAATFKKALELEDQRLANAQKNELYLPGDNNAFQRLGYRTRGLYATYLANWYKYVPKQNILILDSKEFSKDPQIVFNSVTEFLNIKHCEKINFDKKNVTEAKEVLDKEIQSQLNTFYKPHNEELFKLIGKQFNW